MSKSTKTIYEPFSVGENVFGTALNYYIGHDHDDVVRDVMKNTEGVIFPKGWGLGEKEADSDGYFLDLDMENKSKTRVLALERFDADISGIGNDGVHQIGVLVHEAIHAAQAICADRGLPTGWDEPEVMAYLTQFYFQQGLGAVMQAQYDRKEREKAAAKRKRKKSTARRRVFHDDEDD